MKYNDNHSLKWRADQYAKTANDSLESDRNVRRKTAAQLKNFEIKILKYIDRIWWNSLELETKKKIYYKYHNEKIFNKDFDLKDWIIDVSKKIKPNKSLYRENRIDLLLKDSN